MGACLALSTVLGCAGEMAGDGDGGGGAHCQPGGPGLDDCGPAGAKESCCTSPAVPGGTFYRDYDPIFSTSMNSPATLSGLRIDKYEITVGRFRQFALATEQGWLPPAGSGKHVHLNGGQGLVDLAGPPGTHEVGWDSAWNVQLATTAAGWDQRLACNSFATWTSAPGGNERRPLNCVTWYEAYAFCIWDGGFLPSDAELNYADSGGSEQRAYPWSSPPTSQVVDCTYANNDMGGGGAFEPCAKSRTNDVGSESPKGDGKWGQADLEGNVWEWVLDQASGGTPCTDCTVTSLPPDVAHFPPDGAFRTIRGGGLGAPLFVSAFDTDSPTERNIEQGARCARAP